MKVLVATTKGQGKRSNDFCYANEGELVGFSLECDGERIDGGCGCRRSVVGFDSLKATTTFEVVDSPLTEQEFCALHWNSLCKCGWDSIGLKRESSDAQAKCLLALAGRFAVGSVLERRGRSIRARR